MARVRLDCRLCGKKSVAVLRDGGEHRHKCPHGQTCVGPMRGSDCAECWERHRRASEPKPEAPETAPPSTEPPSTLDGLIAQLAEELWAPADTITVAIALGLERAAHLRVRESLARAQDENRTLRARLAELEPHAPVEPVEHVAGVEPGQLARIVRELDASLATWKDTLVQHRKRSRLVSAAQVVARHIARDVLDLKRLTAEQGHALDAIAEAHLVTWATRARATLARSGS